MYFIFDNQNKFFQIGLLTLNTMEDVLSQRIHPKRMSEMDSLNRRSMRFGQMKSFCFRNSIVCVRFSWNALPRISLPFLRWQDPPNPCQKMELWNLETLTLVDILPCVTRDGTRVINDSTCVRLDTSYHQHMTSIWYPFSLNSALHVVVPELKGISEKRPEKGSLHSFLVLGFSSALILLFVSWRTLFSKPSASAKQETLTSASSFVHPTDSLSETKRMEDENHSDSWKIPNTHATPPLSTRTPMPTNIKKKHPAQHADPLRCRPIAQMHSSKILERFAQDSNTGESWRVCR